MMELDEAIKHCFEVAEKNDGEAEVYDLLAKNHNNPYEKLSASRFYTDCAECAADHRQLAEWLRELKSLREENKVLISECDRLIKEKGELLKKSEQIAEYKRLLKAAVEGFRFLGAWMDEHGDCTLDCSECPLHHPGINCRCWDKQAEALALIGKEGGNDEKNI